MTLSFSCDWPIFHFFRYCKFKIIMYSAPQTRIDDQELELEDIQQEDGSTGKIGIFGEQHSTPTFTLKDIASNRRLRIYLAIIVAAVIAFAFIMLNRDQCKNIRSRYLDVSVAKPANAYPRVDVLPSVTLNISYASKEESLPIDPLRTNSHGQAIQDVLYDEPTRKKRIEFIEERASLIDAYPHFTGLSLAKYNIASNEQQQKKGIEENERDWQRLDAKFQLSTIKKELPMCLIVAGYNNNIDFRIQGNLNSIFTQNYTNYKVVIIEDASPDGSGQVYRNYLSFHSIDKHRYTYIENLIRLTNLPNLYLGAVNHCSKESIVLHVDADDQLIGRNVLQVFNWAYQIKKAGVVYSNFYFYKRAEQISIGFTSQYTEQEKKGNLFRKVQQRYSQLRSYRNQLAFEIDPKDLQSSRGEFFPMTGDQIILLPILQLSCGRVYKIQGEVNYLYNIGDWNGNKGQYSCGHLISDFLRMNLTKYGCSKQFEERMKKQ